MGPEHSHTQDMAKGYAGSAGFVWKGKYGAISEDPYGITLKRPSSIKNPCGTIAANRLRAAAGWSLKDGSSGPLIHGDVRDLLGKLYDTQGHTVRGALQWLRDKGIVISSHPINSFSKQL